MNMLIYYLERFAAILAAIILLQTLYFKFSGAEESIYIFTQLGTEPYGRYGSGLIELAAGALLLRRATSLYGAVLGLGTMAGAIFAHLTVLGISVKDDGGSLFYLALLTAAACATVIALQFAELRTLLKRFLG